jgi:aspartyl-tRNA(Asn)/glutamyl-tRNA(Gln) amidotransferase subunit A
LIGKLAMVELAGGGGYRYPAASLTGPGLNP